MRLIIVVLSTFITTIIVTEAHHAWSMGTMFQQKEKSFRFEDYDTAEGARLALLKLRPKGSHYSLLMQTLESAGAACLLLNRNTGEKIKELQTEDHFIRCSYTQKGMVLKYEWAVLIECNGSIPRTHVKDIKVLRELITL